MSQALYRKYRPRSWAQVIGQDHVIQTLKNAIAADRVGHAYLFAGPRGTGKTTVARILAKAVNCLAADPANRPCDECENCRAVNQNRFLDLIEMDAASNTGVDDVRDLRDKIGFSPSQGKYRVYIIDEVHMLSTPAFNALLKTLEEPPPHAIFVLATTEIHKIPATVLSRCQRHEFRRVAVREIVANLRQIVESEGWHADDEALTLIARQATGSIRDAQSLLDQLSSAGMKITLDLAQSVLGTAASQAVLDMIDAVDRRNSAVALETLRRAVDSGADPRTLARQIVEYLRSLLLLQLGNPEDGEAPGAIREHMSAQVARVSSGEVLRMLKVFNAAATDTRGGWQPSLSLELAIAEVLEDRSGPSRLSGKAAGAPDSNSGPAATSGRTRANAAAIEEPASDQGPGRAASLPARPRALQLSPRADESQTVAEPEGSRADGPSSPLVGLSQIARSWKDIRLALRPSHPGVEALLNSCKPVEVQGDELTLGFQSETVRALMDKPENIRAARQAIAEVLGANLKITCVVTNARGKVPPNLAPDGMVATAVDHGGEIVDLQE